MKETWRIDWLRLWAGIGLFHYALAVVAWSVAVYLLVHLDGDHKTWTYLAVRMVPCLLMLSGFLAAVVIAKRRRWFTKCLVCILSAITLIWFASDAYRHDYQIQTMTDRGCDHFYMTWWWYNDRWDPRR